MNGHTAADQFPERPRLSSENYNLIVRQGPEKAKAAGSKERDRKPIDPPPIIQLQIRDSTDPAQNYLQSPYFFICCDLCDATSDRPAPHAPQSALAGTLVSSLHRLKDIDNSDGGFFVFGDLSIKVEGRFRLRFSLFEIIKSEVIYIKCVLSEPFHVFAQKNFPGMSESTFLSRSFGDQGVRLRIRKEARTMLKRPPPAPIRPEDFPQTAPPPQVSTEYDSKPVPQLKTENPGSSGPRNHQQVYTDPPSKRQRTSLETGERGFYDDPKQGQVSYDNQRNMNVAYSTQSQPPTYGFGYGQGPAPEHVMRHQRTDSSSTPSPYSPLTDHPNYLLSTPGQMYSTHGRESMFPYLQGAFPTNSRSDGGQYTRPAIPHRGQVPDDRQQIAMAYGRGLLPEDNSMMHAKYAVQPQSAYPSSYQNDSRLPAFGPLSDSLSATRQQQVRSSPAHVLPPLGATVTARQPRTALPHTYQSSIAPNMQTPLAPVPSQLYARSGQEIQGTLPADYKPPLHHQLGSA